MLPAGKEHVGEVCIIGPQVMKGYWKKQEETDKVLFSHPNSNWKGLRTGDMGYMDDDGWLFLVDRSKDLIISSGYNVYPRMIEEAVYEHPAVDECIVIGIPDPLPPGSAQGVRQAEARRLAHLRGAAEASRRQDRQARDAGRARDPRRAAQDSGRQALQKELKEEERAKAQAKAA